MQSTAPRFSLKENILFSNRTFLRLLRKTFFNSRHTQARLTPRRFVTMLFFFMGLFVLQTMHWVAFIIDEIFFRGYRSIEIPEPLFIVGVPRSGTTFLHRLLARDKDRFTTFTLWELILAPTITERKFILGLAAVDRLLGSPVQRLVHRAERSLFGSVDDIHRISLFEPEEDYFTLVPIYACFLMILPFPFPEDLGKLAFFDDQMPERDKERIMAYYKTCLQRHLYVRGENKVFLSKNVSFTPMLEGLFRTFPDCRIIGTVRDPVFAVPSHISSMVEGASFFDNHIRGDAFRDHMIDVQRYAYTRLAEVLPLLPENRQVTLRMEDLQSDLYSAVRRIYDRFGYKMTPGFENCLRLHHQRQKTYKSGHKYDPSSFNLSCREIFRRFIDVYHRFGYAPPAYPGG